MDEQRFDQLSRRLGTARTRRQTLRAVAGALVASVVGLKATEHTLAQACVNNYGSCSSDGQCCPGAACEWGMCMPGCRIDGQFAHPYSSPAGNSCQVCNPAVSTTSGSATNEGSPCWSGNAFGGPTYCQSGVCAPEGPQSCPPLTACHLEGEINPANGLCVSPPAPEGTPCGIGEMCHGGFYSPAAACNGDGHCIAGGSKTENCAPYQCAGTACATSCSSNSDCTNGATCCEGNCIYLNTIDHCGRCGDTCADVDTCTPAICDDGMCSQTSACPNGTGCCNGQCVSLNTIDNCGTCGYDCQPVDACTPAFCDGGTCNQVSACTGNFTCVGDSCVCVPRQFCQETCDEGDGCGGICAGQAPTTPAISVTFASSTDPVECPVQVSLSGFSGCTAYDAEVRFMSGDDSGPTGPLEFPVFTLGTTDPSGSLNFAVPGLKAKGIWVEALIGGVSSGYARVDCSFPIG